MAVQCEDHHELLIHDIVVITPQDTDEEVISNQPKWLRYSSNLKWKSQGFGDVQHGVGTGDSLRLYHSRRSRLKAVTKVRSNRKWRPYEIKSTNTERSLPTCPDNPTGLVESFQSIFVCDKSVTHEMRPITAAATFAEVTSKDHLKT